AAQRYRGLRGGQHMAVSDSDAGLLVRPEVARQQLNAETPAPQPSGGEGTDMVTSPSPESPPPLPSPAAPSRPRRFHGTVTLDPTRAGRDASKITDEVFTHLAGLLCSSVRATLRIY